MARITVEDCLENVDNLFDLVLIAAKRARQLANGAEARVEWENDKPTVVALREIAAGQVTAELLAEPDPVPEPEMIPENPLDLAADFAVHYARVHANRVSAPTDGCDDSGRRVDHLVAACRDRTEDRARDDQEQTPGPRHSFSPDPRQPVHRHPAPRYPKRRDEVTESLAAERRQSVPLDELSDNAGVCSAPTAHSAT